MIGGKMDITFLCGNCHQPLSIDEGGAGMTIDCPNCAKPVYVPSQPSGAAAPVAPATTTPAPVKRLAFAAATPAGTRAATTTMPAPAPATAAKPSAGNVSRSQKDPKKSIWRGFAGNQRIQNCAPSF